ncbi:MAG: hypothetical protein JWS12_850 [Candidatus Saccharibacteria bacterium]|nr:hypothetical protein [Candidatus Saccharibacteria bacterium]
MKNLRGEVSAFSVLLKDAIVENNFPDEWFKKLNHAGVRPANQDPAHKIPKILEITPLILQREPIGIARLAGRLATSFGSVKWLEFRGFDPEAAEAKYCFDHLAFYHSDPQEIRKQLLKKNIFPNMRTAHRITSVHVALTADQYLEFTNVSLSTVVSDEFNRQIAPSSYRAGETPPLEDMFAQIEDWLAETN